MLRKHVWLKSFENDNDFLARKERMLAVKRRQCPLYSCQFLKVGGTVAQSRSSRFQNAKTRQNARCPQPQMPWQCMELRGADSVDSDSEYFFCISVDMLNITARYIIAFFMS